MRPLGLTDTIFYNLGDCNITAAAVLDGPCDLARFLAELEGVIAAVPALGERPIRLGVWFFARRKSGPVDLAEHVAVIRDRSITSLDDLVPLLERLRRSPLRTVGAPWRMYVVNPAEIGEANDGPAPLSAILVQGRHGLADAMRGLQVLARMGRYEATPAQGALAAQLPTIDPASFSGDVRVHDVGLSVLKVPRRGMNRDVDASVRLTAAAAEAVRDVALFPHAQPLRGSIGRTRFVLRRSPANGLGNHLKMVTVPTRERSRRRRWHIPGLARAQNLQLTQWLVALAPRPLARLMMRIWYSNFDAVATLVPLPRRLVLGGRAVAAVFGVPPLWGPVPLVLIALADGEHYHVTVVPGRGFTGSREALLERLRALLNPDAPTELPEAAMLESPAAGRSRYGQGADGSMLSPVSRPLSAKSP